MTVARVYRMIAADGKEEALHTALVTLAATVIEQPGCEGVELLRDTGNPGRVLFIEKWASVAAHRACLGGMPADALAPISAAVSGPSEGAYMEYAVMA